MAEYVPPEWGVDGANAFGIFLEVIKGGVVLEKQALPVTPGRSCVVAGRLPPPTCDLELAHASSSRVHAALQFDAQGALFLCDLGSTHGSFVNKARAPAHEFVRLHIGDVLAFGESSRLYAVCGPAELLPAEYDSLNVRAFRDKSARRQQAKAAQRRERRQRVEAEDDGASWGFREDAVDEDDDDEDGDNDDDDRQEGSDDERHGGKEKLPDYLRNVNDKDQKLFEQLQARIRKMENLKLESARIQAKQNQLPGLSAGQEATLARNEQRVQALRKDIAELEGRIHAKNAQRAKTASDAAGRDGRQPQPARAADAAYGYESDDDDFYDRTASNQRKQQARRHQELGGGGGGASATAAADKGPPQATAASGGALTAASIQAAIRTLESELLGLVREQEAAQAQQPTQQEAGGDVDSLDAFMASTTQALHATQLAAVTSRRQAVEAELRRQQQLLAIATPALARVSTPMHLEVASTTKQQQSGAVVSTAAGKTDGRTGDTVDDTPDDTSLSVAAPAKRPAESPTSAAAEPQRVTDTASASSAAKKRRVVGPAFSPSSATMRSRKRTAAAAASVGTATPTVEGESSVLEGGERVWVPPAGQTGDGRTTLNDKFGY
ncbi:hypothetical protein PybrP1_006981 [[Pythium] brassicae (nom. inval.)]|nr:hypothetical protein PybrP1_006981 [[Pythium] brassicae (nom. inval.)]